jgi:protein-L-isoaspartate(D-aspartate) O-methyltransferase
MDFALSRFNMVEGQIKTNRVTDPYVIDAMAEVPRESFVPISKKGFAYIDDALEVAKGRFLIEPLVLARMLDAAALSEDDVVLDIGCTTGYSTAVIAKIVNTVVAVESDAELAKLATSTLNSLGIDNAIVVNADLKDGYPKQGPYNVIVFNGAITEIPQNIKDQLAEGGRLLVITQGTSSMSTVSVYTRNNRIFSKRDIMEAGVSVLPGFEIEKGFTF